MKFPTIEEMAQNVAEKALDEYEYKGKTLREWVEIISAIPVTAIPATDINVGTKDGTNLASLGTDCISREQAIDALGELATFTEDWSSHTWMYTDDVYNAIKQLPTIQPKRGRWIPVDAFTAFGGDEATWMAHGNPTAFHYCSVCKGQAYAGEDGESLLTDFCPNCGADMRGN